MVKFAVQGPHDVPIYQGKFGRIVRSEEAAQFFQRHAALADRRGCYVFAMRAGGGITPTYVGKATKTFKKECFTSHKLGKCNETLVDYERGTLVAFFVLAPRRQGRPAERQIGLVEEFLINAAVAANPDLLNVKGTKKADWAIGGVIRAGRGRPSGAASSFRSAMRLRRSRS